MMIRTYQELKNLHTFEERYTYLRLQGIVGEATFGFNRHINQMLYTSYQWQKARDKIIIRDKGCDLGIEGYEIPTGILVHHMNPITLEDIERQHPHVFDPEFLICTCINTHNAIHFGDESLLPKSIVIRQRNDTCPWR